MPVGPSLHRMASGCEAHPLAAHRGSESQGLETGASRAQGFQGRFVQRQWHELAHCSIFVATLSSVHVRCNAQLCQALSSWKSQIMVVALVHVLGIRSGCTFLWPVVSGWRTILTHVACAPRPLCWVGAEARARSGLGVSFRISGSGGRKLVLSGSRLQALSIATPVVELAG